MDEKEEKDDKEYTKYLIKFYIKEILEKKHLNEEEKEYKKKLLKRCNYYIEQKKMNVLC